MFEKVINGPPEVNKPLSAKYKRSFAYPTFKDRAPKILEGVIHCLKKKDILKEYGETAVEEVEVLVAKIKELIEQMKTDQPLTEINPNNGFVDKELQVYNNMLKEKQSQGQVPTWFETEWLFAECYMYRRLNQIFKNSTSMQMYDPFMDVKIDTLLGSKELIVKIANILYDLKSQTVTLTEEKTREMFMYFIKCALWGNKADLSLSGGKAVATKENSFTSGDSAILVNDAAEVYKTLSTCPKQNRIVDIILDNAGFELYNDFCLADFLLWSGLATKINFHGKAIPWFVSDVTRKDFDIIFELMRSEIQYNKLDLIMEQWHKYLRDGSWTMECEPFWVLPTDYSEMKEKGPELYTKLSKSCLLIFKGDLNYRKLMGDIFWEPTTPFRVALRGFEPTNLVALRTIKADTISGLKPGVAEATASIAPDWMVTGDYAVVQFLKKDA